MSTVAEAVRALRVFADQLADNPAFITTVDWEVRGPAPAGVIAYYRANPQLLPRDLVDLYELMNGCDLNWAFRTAAHNGEDFLGRWNSAMVGRLNLPPLRLPGHKPAVRGLRFASDRENQYTFFGPTTVSLFFDQMEPEYGTWLVAYGPADPYAPWNAAYEPYKLKKSVGEAAHANARPDDYRLVYVVATNEEHLLSGTLADYLLRGVAAGFVFSWPLLYQERGEEPPYLLQQFNEQFHRYQAAQAA